MVLPLSLALATSGTERSTRQSASQQSLRQALAEAIGQRSYTLLVLGYFTCGFQLAFITVHLPALWSQIGSSTFRSREFG